MSNPHNFAAALFAVLAACGCWLAMTGAGEPPLPGPSGRAAAACVPEPPVAMAAPLCVREVIDVAVAAEEVPVTVPDRTPEFLAIVARIEGGDASHEAVGELRDVLVGSPELSRRVPELLATAQDLTARRLLQALELTGTAACQDTLAHIATDGTRARPDRMRALVALGRLPEPGETTMQRLWAAYRDQDPELSRAALLAFGRAAATVRSVDCSRGVGASTSLAIALQGAFSSEAMVVALKAIGRSQDASLNAAVVPFTGSADAAVRAAAAQALAATGG